MRGWVRDAGRQHRAGMRAGQGCRTARSGQGTAGDRQRGQQGPGRAEQDAASTHSRSAGLAPAPPPRTGRTIPGAAAAGRSDGLGRARGAPAAPRRCSARRAAAEGLPRASAASEQPWPRRGSPRARGWRRGPAGSGAWSRARGAAAGGGTAPRPAMPWARSGGAAQAPRTGREGGDTAGGVAPGPAPPVGSPPRIGAPPPPQRDVSPWDSPSAPRECPRSRLSPGIPAAGGALPAGPAGVPRGGPTEHSQRFSPAPCVGASPPLCGGFVPADAGGHRTKNPLSPLQGQPRSRGCHRNCSPPARLPCLWER